MKDPRRRPWADIHDDYKVELPNGDRLVMVSDGARGTVLVPWIGPDEDEEED